MRHITEDQLEFQCLMAKCGFELAAKNVGDSFIYGCTFFATHIKDVYATDYDINMKIPIRNGTAIFFSTKQKKYLFVSFEFIRDSAIDLIEYLSDVFCSDQKQVD